MRKIYPKWTKEEEEILFNNLHLSCDELSTLIEKTPKAIYAKAHRHNIFLRHTVIFKENKLEAVKEFKQQSSELTRLLLCRKW